MNRIMWMVAIAVLIAVVISSPVYSKSWSVLVPVPPNVHQSGEVSVKIADNQVVFPLYEMYTSSFRSLISITGPNNAMFLVYEPAKYTQETYNISVNNVWYQLSLDGEMGVTTDSSVRGPSPYTSKGSSYYAEDNVLRFGEFHLNIVGTTERWAIPISYTFSVRITESDPYHAKALIRNHFTSTCGQSDFLGHHVDITGNLENFSIMQVVSVPEPSGLLAVGGGVIGFIGIRRRKE